MSVRVIAMVFEGGPEDLAQHSVMMALADNADDFGVAWPGHELLARKSRLSVRSVIRVLEALESGGWLVKRKRRAGEHRRGNVYELNLARLGGRHGRQIGGEHGEANVQRVSGDVSETQSLVVQQSFGTESTVHPGEGCPGRNRKDQQLKSEVSGVSMGCAAAILPIGDTVSRHAFEDAVNAGGCASLSDTVSRQQRLPAREVTSTPGEVTSTTPRSDTTLAELLLDQRDAVQNRQEPSREPSFPPTPPKGGTSCGSGPLRGGIVCSGDASRESCPDAHGGLDAEQQAELDEVNAMRARHGWGRALTWEEYARAGLKPIQGTERPGGRRRRRMRR